MPNQSQPSKWGQRFRNLRDNIEVRYLIAGMKRDGMLRRNEQGQWEEDRSWKYGLPPGSLGPRKPCPNCGGNHTFCSRGNSYDRRTPPKRNKDAPQYTQGRRNPGSGRKVVCYRCGVPGHYATTCRR